FLRKARIRRMVRALENRAGDPAVALVEVGIAAVAVGVAVVLRVEKGREVGRVVDVVRPSPSGEQLEVVGKALGDGERKSIVERITRRGLRIHVAPWHWDRNTAGNDAYGEIGGLREPHERCIATRDQRGEGRIGARGTEIVKDSGRADQADRCPAAIGRRETLAENSRRNQENASCRRYRRSFDWSIDARIGHAGTDGNGNGERI